jgi:MFS family permease
MTTTRISPKDSSQPWHDGLTPRHWRVLVASFLGWTFDGYESYALIVVLPAALPALLTADQLQSSAVWAGVAIGVTLLGWGIGGLIGGTLADYVGRKRIMVLSVFAYAMFSGITAFSSTFFVFAALRFLTGFAMGSEWSTGVAMVAETWPDRARPKGAGFLQSGFGWGTLLAALTWWLISRSNPLGENSWRLMFLVGALPALFTFYIRRAIQESDRWLTAVREKRWATTEKDQPGPNRRQRRPLTLTEIFRQPESRRRVFLVFLLSFASIAGWYAVSSWLPAYTQELARAAQRANALEWANRAAILYTIGAVLGYLVSGFLIDTIGRRKFLFVTYAGSLLMTLITYGWVRSVESMMGAALINGFFTLGLAYSWMAIYLAELFTSSVRSTASSFVFNGTRLIAWLFPILAGNVIQTFGGVSHAALSLGLVYVLGLIVPWFVPETTGKPLPD